MRARNGISRARLKKDKAEVIPMRDLFDPSEMPIGLGMAFAENVDAMRRFSAMSRPDQQAVVTKAHDIKSRDEMHAYVRSLLP